MAIIADYIYSIDRLKKSDLSLHLTSKCTIEQITQLSQQIEEQQPCRQLYSECNYSLPLQVEMANDLKILPFLLNSIKYLYGEDILEEEITYQRGRSYYTSSYSSQNNIKIILKKEVQQWVEHVVEILTLLRLAEITQKIYDYPLSVLLYTLENKPPSKDYYSRSLWQSNELTTEYLHIVNLFEICRICNINDKSRMWLIQDNLNQYYKDGRHIENDFSTEELEIFFIPEYKVLHNLTVTEMKSVYNMVKGNTSLWYLFERLHKCGSNLLPIDVAFNLSEDKEALQILIGVVLQ